MRMFPVMVALDSDGNGEISSEEIKGAVAALKKLDKNKDGKLTEDELRPSFGGRGGIWPASISWWSRTRCTTSRSTVTWRIIFHLTYFDRSRWPFGWRDFLPHINRSFGYRDSISLPDSGFVIVLHKRRYHWALTIVLDEFSTCIDKLLPPVDVIDQCRLKILAC